jgi:addiction module HigA family antidote
LILWIIIERGMAMRMKNPPHPGELIGDSLHELGWTIVDAARALRISRQQLHNIVSGRSAVTPKLAVKLEKALGSTADVWLRMQNAYDLARLQRGGGGSDVVQRFMPRHEPQSARASARSLRIDGRPTRNAKMRVVT